MKLGMGACFLFALLPSLAGTSSLKHLRQHGHDQQASHEPKHERTLHHSLDAKEGLLLAPWEPVPCGVRGCPVEDDDPDTWTLAAMASRALRTGAGAGGVGGSRLCRLRARLRARGQPPLRVYVLGGSLTAGTFLTCANSTGGGAACAWPQLLAAALRVRSPGRVVAPDKTPSARSAPAQIVEVRSLAKGGTTTFWAVAEAHRLPPDADLVIVDYDVQ